MKYDRFTSRRVAQTQTLYPRVRLILIAGCVGLCAVTFTSIFFYSRVFTIEFVDVQAVGGIDQEGARRIVFEQMERSRFWIFPQRNLLIFSRAELERELSKRFIMQTLSIDKRLPHTLSLSITGEPFRLLHISGSRILDLAPDGSLAADLTEQRGDHSPSIEIARTVAAGAMPASKEIPDVPIVKADVPLNGETITFIRSVFSLARSRGYHPLSFEVGSNAPTITLHMREGWDVLLTSLGDPSAQLSSVAAVLDAHFKKERKGLHYIDVRFDNRVYYQ